MGAQAAPRTLDAETLLSLRAARSATLSPDGSSIVYGVSRPPRSASESSYTISEIWRVDDACRGRQAPARIGDGEAPQWSPDAAYIAWLGSAPDGRSRIHILPAEVNVAPSAPLVTAGATAYRWSPDGRFIAFTAVEPPSPPSTDLAGLARDVIIDGGRIAPVRLRVLEVDTGAAWSLDSPAASIGDFAWSPDSRSLVYVGFPSGDADASYLRGALYLSDRRGRAVSEFSTQTRSAVRDPEWSTDGRWIAWRSGANDTDPSDGAVFVAAVDAGPVSPRALTPDLEASVADIAWSRTDPGVLLAQAVARQKTLTLAISVETGARRTLMDHPFVSTDLPSFSRDGSRWATAAHARDHPGEIYCAETGGAPVRVTRQNPQLDGIDLGSQDTVSWRSSDDMPIEGVLIKPPGWQDKKPLPTIVSVHGGPESAELDGWHGQWHDGGQFWATRGYLVLYPNYRGSIGRGSAFARAAQGDPMGRSYDDIVSGLDHLVDAGLADPRRAGVYGYSWGGYAAAWAATFGRDTFAASVVAAGFTNWISHVGMPPHGSSPVHDQLAHLTFMIYEPGRMLQVLKRSPVYHVDKAETPTLFLHGAEDQWVSQTQAHELFHALKWKGVDTALVVYPHEGHTIRRSEHRRDFLFRKARWFDRFLTPARPRQASGALPDGQ